MYECTYESVHSIIMLQNHIALSTQLRTCISVYLSGFDEYFRLLGYSWVGGLSFYLYLLKCPIHMYMYFHVHVYMYSIQCCHSFRFNPSNSDF